MHIRNETCRDDDAFPQGRASVATSDGSKVEDPLPFIAPKPVRADSPTHGKSARLQAGGRE